MKRNSIFRRIVLFMFMPFLLACPTLCSKKTEEKNSKQNLIGYIFDEHCFAKTPFPGSNSKTRLQMTDCATTGYGIAALQSDITLKFYYFDGDFAPAATDGQLMAEKLINAAARKEDILISVEGTITDKVIRASDGNYFPLIQVSKMRERELD